MLVTLIRHARRDYGIGDAPLNSLGKQQAIELCQEPHLRNVTYILSSPKLRALQTVEPLAKKLELVPVPLKELDQMGPREPESLFVERVESFLDEIGRYSEYSHLLICSHSDWLNMAITILSQKSLSISPSLFDCGQYRRLEFKDNRWENLL